MSQPTGKSNADLARRYIEAVLCDTADHGLVRKHGADRVLRAANTLAVLAVVDAVREGPTPLRDCIAALAPQLQQKRGHQSEFQVGDPDPTPNAKPWCEAEGPDRAMCTWPPGHPGHHVAGDFDEIVAVWP